ncbi:VOC family protein [Dietzia psychralcaliphila]|uniref:2,3-dihydroxybiphenyl 1,2-dioxygenase n=1 Tax=Dietzia psychralcaliphila TaxID=139021 RepID=A0AAD0JP39_9ACTN|nr:VOC family protein [Dietzia psychralcaliphila]AWH95013.1 2,3-dihydroxybiphenyl 1,2-dioxygenase [Dietzia psychralcaliphila]PTM87213.1 glyoxalase/bleomycin resistance protein/dioxygenase superfamily protein [Dietzia psychralcaliphila]
MTVNHDVHEGLHADQGALPGEHPGRRPDPVVKVHDIAWLEFDKPDLVRTAAFAVDFGFTPTFQTPDELHLRGALAGPPCVIVRRAARTAFTGAAFLAADDADVHTLASEWGRPVESLDDALGGCAVTTRDPSGCRVRVVSGVTEWPALPLQSVRQPFNFERDRTRVNSTQRPPRAPAVVERLGHVVLSSTRYLSSLNWYLHNLGMIVSDFLYYPGQRERGPVMSFIRCDRGGEVADHHTLALTLGPADRYVHSAFQVCDLDALAAGSEYLLDRGYDHSWGLGRHIQGSQLFDYWRDPDGFLVEHFTDGDQFDSTVTAGWAPMTASGLNQWGPPATADFLGIKPGRAALREFTSILSSLRESDNEFDVQRLLGLMKVART